MALEALISPASYFEDDEPSLAIPAVIVLAVVVLTVVSGGISVVANADAMAGQGGDAGLMATMGVVGIVVGILWLGVVFLFYAASFHGLTAVFDGEGSFTATMAVVGWGFAPKVLDTLLALIQQAVAAYRVMVVGASPMEAAVGPIATFGVGLVSIGLLLWSGYIWFGGVKAVRNVDSTGAAVAVGIPVALALAWNLFWLLAGTYMASMM